MNRSALSYRRYKVCQDRFGEWGILDILRDQYNRLLGTNVNAFASFGATRFSLDIVLYAIELNAGDAKRDEFSWEPWKPRV